MLNGARIKPWGMAALTAITLAGGAWTLSPARHDSLTAGINFPSGEYQDGQWCVAGGITSGGSGPYQFLWGGDYFSGTNPIATAQMNGSGGVITLRVIDSTPDTAFASPIYPNVGNYEYNPSCEP